MVSGIVSHVKRVGFQRTIVFVDGSSVVTYDEEADYLDPGMRAGVDVTGYVIPF